MVTSISLPTVQFSYAIVHMALPSSKAAIGEIDVVVPAVSSQVRYIHQNQPDGATTSHGNSRRAIRSEKYYI